MPIIWLRKPERFQDNDRVWYSFENNDKMKLVIKIHLH